MLVAGIELEIPVGRRPNLGSQIVLVTVKSLALNEGGQRVMSFVDSGVVITGQEDFCSVLKKKLI